MTWARQLLACAVLSFMYVPAMATLAIQGLEVESLEQPLGIDVEAPRFSWKMVGSDERGLQQKAYRIVVTRSGATAWDSGEVAGAQSINITYAGAPLEPTSRYDWTVTVWDEKGRSSGGQSWFETGLLNPDPQLSGWNGATWIGGSDADLVLHAGSLSIFDLSYTVAIAPGSERAAIVFAANDPRLMDRNKNIYGLENRINESYLKVELDVGPLSATPAGHARLNVYRAGYQATDNPSKPIKSFRINRRFIDVHSQHAARRISIRSEFGTLTLRIDGSAAFFDPDPTAGDNALVATAVMNPAGINDVVTYGLLGDIGFQVNARQSASFFDLVVSNSRPPAKALFREDLTQQPYRGIYKRYADDGSSGLRVVKGAYLVSGGDDGTLLLADPSRNAMPMLRTTFAVKDKKVKAARLYATARGVYELQLNGKRVGDDYFNPGFTQYNRTQLYQTYDVTGLLVAGKNALGAELGEGWWSGLLTYWPIWNHFGDRPSLLAKLVITYEDGSTDIVASNDTWKYFNAGPIVYFELLHGGSVRRNA